MTLVTMTQESFEQMQLIMNGGLIGVIILLVLLITVFLYTPAWPYLQTKFMKRRLLEIFMDDGRKILRAVKYKNSSTRVKGIGIFTFNPKATISCFGVPGAMVFENMSDPIPPEFAKWAYALIREGIDDIETAEGEINDVKIKAMLQNMINHEMDTSAEALKREGFTNRVITIADSMDRVDANTSKPHNALIDYYLIQRFFKYDASPTKQEAIVEMEKSDVLMSVNKGFRITPDHVIGFIMVLMAGAIAWHIVQSGDLAGMAEGGRSAVSAVEGATAAVPPVIMP